MNKISELIKQIELHDSSLYSLKTSWNGSVELEIDFDEVWNKSLPKNLKGLVFNSVYEISEFKIDRLNIIGSVEVTELNDYNKDFVTSDGVEFESTVAVEIEFVTGVNLLIICADSVDYLIQKA